MCKYFKTVVMGSIFSHTNTFIIFEVELYYHFLIPVLYFIRENLHYLIRYCTLFWPVKRALGTLFAQGVCLCCIAEDAHGPLLIAYFKKLGDLSKRWPEMNIITGIVSFDKAYYRDFAATAYIAVSPFLMWIKSKISGTAEPHRGCGKILHGKLHSHGYYAALHQRTHICFAFIW